MLLVSFIAHTRVGDQECFIPRVTMAIAPGEKAAHIRLNQTATNVPRLSLAAAVTAAAAAVSRAAFSFPSLVTGNDLNLGERWGRGCFQDRWPMCWRALMLAYAENWENKLISNCKGDRSCSSEEPERLDWLFIAIKLNSELSLSSDQKTANTWVTWQCKFTIITGI